MVLVDTGSPMVRRRYERLSLERARTLSEMFRSMRIDQINIETGRAYIRDMMAFFRNRERRRCA